MILLVALIMLFSCASTDKGTGYCVATSLVPMTIPFLFAICKVACFKRDRIILWTSFVLWQITQMVTLFAGKATFNPLPSASQRDGPVWFYFIPSMMFGIAIGVEMLYESITYIPVREVKLAKYFFIACSIAGLVNFSFAIYYSYLDVYSTGAIHRKYKNTL